MKKFEGLGRSLDAAEMKSIMGGNKTVDPGGGGGACLEVWSYDCSTASPCCFPAKCEQKATNSGTICVIR